MLATTRAAGYRTGVPSEVAVTARLTPMEPSPQKPPILIYAHYLGGTADTWFSTVSPKAGPSLQRVAHGGFLAVVTDLAGSGFGNDAVIGAGDDAYTLGVAAGGDPNKVYTLSASMGTFFLNWVRLHLDKVKACALTLPVPDMDVARNTAWSTGSLAAFIDAAYPANWTGQTTAFKNAHDPKRYASELTGLPLATFEDTNDPFYIESTMYADFATAVGGSAFERHSFAGGGHTLDNMDVNAPWDFLRRHL